ncbi:MAG: shikimate dehydrogenase [Bacteroidota bacterium]
MFRQFGLIGKKLGHSFSKKYFSQKFEEQGIDAAYELYELAEITAFEKLKETPHLKGLNVTIPYKAEVIPFLDELAAEAAAIQAVNTIKFENGKLKGFNSDIYGFWDSLLEFSKGEEISGAIILGNGGATRAVLYVLEEKLGVGEVKIATRNPRSANHLAYSDLEGLELDKFPLIVNTTPLGMYPDIEACPTFPYHKLGDKHWAYDLIYNPEETSFMKAAAQYGAQTKNGMDMLIGQAEKSWEFWNS